MLERYTSIYELDKTLQFGLYYNTEDKEVYLFVDDCNCFNIETKQIYEIHLLAHNNFIRLEKVVYIYDGELYQDENGNDYIKLVDGKYYNVDKDEISVIENFTDVYNGVVYINNDDF